MKVNTLFVFMLLLTVSAFSQERPYRKIATQEVHQRLMSENPSMQEALKTIEKHAAKFQKREKITPVTIPVVFHIIYHGDLDRVSEGQVISQIEALNRDFGSPSGEIRHPADTLEGFAEKAADPEIKFCLAAVAAKGSTIPGIHYVRSETPSWKTDDAIKFSKTKGTDAIGSAYYINVWVASLGEGVSGYAQIPGGSFETDGIVIDFRFFGIGGTSIPPYDEGKTLTHLMGNYLGLYDIWGGSHCQDDFVDDTPLHNLPNDGCPGYKHITTCGNGSVEMTMNFMDNTDDACMYMFTAGQVERMHAMLVNSIYRKGLVGGVSVCSGPLKERDDGEGTVLTGGNTPTELSVKAYPNPTSSNIQVLISSLAIGPVTISIFNPLGMLVYRTTIDMEGSNHQLLIDSADWTEGAYFLKVFTDREIYSKKFFVKH